MSLTQHAHHMIQTHFAKQNTPIHHTIDATCGNGFDSLFLLKLGCTHLWAFDIQTQAINNTQQRLSQHGYHNITLIQDSHANLLNYCDTADCIMFNLGYLPRADHAITTQKDVSLAAIHAATQCLNPNGILSVICYPGHPEGKREAQAIERFFTKLHRQKTNLQYQSLRSDSSKTNAPILHLLTK